MQTLEDYIERTQACDSEEELFRQFDAYIKYYGFDFSSYHILAEGLRAIPIASGVVRHTVPEDWVKRYIARQYFKIDPILEQSRREARPFHWFDIDKIVNLNAQQEQFLKELKGAGFTDGLAVPAFGPKGTIACFALGCIGSKLELTGAQELFLQFGCLQTQNRYFELARKTYEAPSKPLSPREKQVLCLVAEGHPNNHIAECLGITENTVDTMLRRTFAKLGVNNRISAVLKGIGDGMIMP